MRSWLPVSKPRQVTEATGPAPAPQPAPEIDRDAENALEISRLVEADLLAVVREVTDHNLELRAKLTAEPRRPNDPKWNIVHSRNRRFFFDRAAMSAARNLRPFLVQSSVRTVGDGDFVMMKDLSAPVRIRGRHFGAFRWCFPIDKVVRAG